jgi:hypothetical protein
MHPPNGIGSIACSASRPEPNARVLISLRDFSFKFAVTLRRPLRLQRPPAMNANRSQSPCERVSVRGDKICRERVCASQRPGGILPPQFAHTQSRDRKRRPRSRECPGKLGVLPETAENRIRTRLRGGPGRTRTCNHSIMSASGRTFEQDWPVLKQPPAQARRKARDSNRNDRPCSGPAKPPSMRSPRRAATAHGAAQVRGSRRIDTPLITLRAFKAFLPAVFSSKCLI